MSGPDKLPKDRHTHVEGSARLSPNRKEAAKKQGHNNRFSKQFSLLQEHQPKFCQEEKYFFPDEWEGPEIEKSGKKARY
jgi:hypothetical protein